MALKRQTLSVMAPVLEAPLTPPSESPWVPAAALVASVGKGALVVSGVSGAQAGYLPPSLSHTHIPPFKPGPTPAQGLWARVGWSLCMGGRAGSRLIRLGCCMPHIAPCGYCLGCQNHVGSLSCQSPSLGAAAAADLGPVHTWP